MKKDYLKYIAALLLFGTNGIVASGIGLPSYEIVLFRAGLGALFLVSAFCVLRTPQLLKDPRKLGLIALSGVSMGACWLFAYMGYSEAGVGLTSLLFALGPVVVMALSPLLFGDGLRKRTIIGFLAVLAGVVLANGGKLDSGAAIGIVHGICSALAYASMIILSKKAGDADGLESSTVQLVAAFATAAVGMALSGTGIQIPDSSDIAPALILGLVNTGIGSYLYFSAVTNLSAQSVAVCSYVEPVTAVVMAAMVLGESMVVVQWAGALLVIGGAVFCEVSKRFAFSPHFR